MTTTNNDNNKQTDNVVEIKGKKFTVTPEFKKAIDEDRAELTTRAKTSETQVLTLSERIASLGKESPKSRQADPDDDNDEPATFDHLIEDTDGTIGKAVAKALKKAGLHSDGKGGAIDLEKRIELKQQQDKYWTAFYAEHDYFSEDEHDFLIKGMTRKLLPTIKDLPLKEGRKKIADAVANMMGRAIKGGKLEVATEPKHKAQNGMQLESADGGVLDGDDNPDNTKGQENSGSMGEILRNRADARKKGGKK